MTDTDTKAAEVRKVDPLADGLDLTTTEGQQTYATRAERKFGKIDPRTGVFAPGREIDAKTGRLEGEFARIPAGE